MKKMICIICPRGCHLEITEKMEVSGNRCLRGIKYAREELVNPTRNISTTVKIDSKYLKRLPVKTSLPIPKSKILDVMQEIRKVKLKIPIRAGDIIIENILNLKTDIIASRSIEE